MLPLTGFDSASIVRVSRGRRVRLTGKALEIGPAVEQVYNHVFMLAVQGISQDELDYFINLFSRISENFAREE